MEASEILKKFSPEHDNMLNILHALQDNNPYNYLEEKDLKAVADHLNTTMSHVYGVVNYYTMLSVRPRGKFIIRACKSPVCCIAGSCSVLDELKSILQVEPGNTTEDRMFTLEESECLGQCDIAPVMMINDKVYGRLNAERLRSIIENHKKR